jgi:hypothetical protein
MDRSASTESVSPTVLRLARSPMVALRIWATTIELRRGWSRKKPIQSLSSAGPASLISRTSEPS